jgi:type I restriction enzyme S subunit
MKNISLDKLRSIKLSLPPLDLQPGLAARVAKIDAIKTRYRAHLAELDALFASLQHHALPGEL